MSLSELTFRVKQYVQKKRERKYIGWQPDASVQYLPELLLPFASTQTPTVTFPFEHPIFEHTVDIRQPIDWHLDVSSNRRFPLTFAKDLDIRSGSNGSAKYVWEINRLLFLPQLAVQYRQTKNPTFLARFIELNTSWIEENPYLMGVNWYSNIEVNIRLINWFISWNILDASALAQTDHTFRAFVEKKWLPTIFQHCTYSYQNPSHYSSANNHQIAEYAGLFVAASFWQFPQSTLWRMYAKAGLEREILQQHGPNGINREEAAEYIQFITDFFLIAHVVGDLTKNSFSDQYNQKLKQIFAYIAQFLDCQGIFPRYGDEDDGRVLRLDDGPTADPFQSLLRSGAVLFGEPLFKQRSAISGTPRFDLKNSILFGVKGQQTFANVPHSDELLGSVLYEEGHYIFRKQEPAPNGSAQREIYIHADAAPLGYLSIAAHGHADALSFLMHVDGCVFLADPGTFTYHTHLDWRRYFVSTRAHNTVCIDEQNQAFQAGSLLWLNHYKPSVISARSTIHLDEVVATHSGYDRLRCRHQRTFRFDKRTDTLYLLDELENYGQQDRRVDVFFHLGPGVVATPLNQNQFVLAHSSVERCIDLQIAADLRSEVITGQTRPQPLGWYSDGFYRKQPTTTIQGSTQLRPGQTLVLTHQLNVQERVTSPSLMAANTRQHQLSI